MDKKTDLNNKGRALIFSAPSGAGKTTIVRHLLKKLPILEFSISTTNRAPRGNEREGIDYYFISSEQFREKIECNEFMEWEEVYTGNYYGTLRSEAERVWRKGKVLVCDVDVKGGINIKKALGEQALAIFVQPPSVESLYERLIQRGTDMPEAIKSRICKAKEELTYAAMFDTVIVNDCLETALQATEQIVDRFLL